MRIVFLMAAFLLMTAAVAQETEKSKQDSVRSPWKTEARTSFNFSQVAFTNWAAGGENSISGNLAGSFVANYKKNKSQWENSLDIGYGLLRQGQDKLQKTDDKVEIVTKYGKKAFMDNKNWYYSAMLSFKTQFAEGYDYPNDSVRISNFMAPAYILVAIGMDYSPNDFFSASASPLTGKVTIVDDTMLANNGSFGVEPGEKMRYEFGGYIKLKLKKEIWENVELDSKLGLFSNYFNNPLNIDLNWDVAINMEVNKFLAVTIQTNMIYDDDINIKVDENDDGMIDYDGPKLQFKEMVGVGLTFKF